MNLESRPLGLSLVDFFGALLPGMVWALLAVALGSSILKPGADGFPVGAAIALIKDAGPRNIIAFLIGSVLAGYAIKPLAMRGSDMLLLSIQYLPARVFQSTKSPLRVRGFRDYYRARKFPGIGFDRAKRPEFMARLDALLNEYLAWDVGTLPVTQFSMCRRILRVLCQPLWEETEHREAEARMLASLFLAAAAAGIGNFIQMCAFRSPLAFWSFALSVSLAALLGAGVKYLRRNEVSYVYAMFLIAMTVQRLSTKQTSIASESRDGTKQ